MLSMVLYPTLPIQDLGDCFHAIKILLYFIVWIYHNLTQAFLCTLWFLFTFHY